MDTHHPLATFTGIFATTTSVGISMLPELEAWLRILSLVIGCAVGIASLYVILTRKHPPE
jgi:hypothetical protein